jgi:transposase-like protein
MDNQQQAVGTERRVYSEAVKVEAMQQRMGGIKYADISQELNVPEDTLKKWFAPSINRHNLATIKEEQFEEFTSASKRLLKANVVAITEKLTEMAVEGDIRAMIEVMDRVHGTPIKQQPKDMDEMPRSVEVTILSTQDEIERLEALKKEISDASAQAILEREV